MGIFPGGYRGTERKRADVSTAVATSTPLTAADRCDRCGAQAYLRVELLVALAIAVGLAGVLVPILPGSILILGAVLVWAVDVGGATAWAVFAVAALILVVGGVVKYLVPNRRLKDAGVPSSTQWVGALVGIVGFFVIPVVGLFIGFVVGVYAAERHRVGSEAWPSTKSALRAVGLSILIELAAAVAATFVWIGGVVAT